MHIRTEQSKKRESSTGQNDCVENKEPRNMHLLYENSQKVVSEAITHVEGRCDGGGERKEEWRALLMERDLSHALCIYRLWLVVWGSIFAKTIIALAQEKDQQLFVWENSFWLIVSL